MQKSIAFLYIAAAAKSLQSCPTLCNPIDGSSSGSPVPGILQARTLEWVAISLSNAWKWKVKVKSLSRVWLFATPWTAAYQFPPSMGFSRQEYWSGVPSPSWKWMNQQYLNYQIYEKLSRTFTAKGIKCYMKVTKENSNTRKRYYANEQENSMSWICRFLPNSFENSPKSQSTCQEEYSWNLID